MSLDRRSLACNLFIPTMLLSTVGDRVFQSTSVSPSLPAFKRDLKTVLFTRSCSDSFACACQFYFAMTLISFVFLCSVLAIFRLPPSSLIPTICKRVFNCKYVSCKICFNVLCTGWPLCGKPGNTSEMSGILLKVREVSWKRSCQGKVA